MDISRGGLWFPQEQMVGPGFEKRLFLTSPAFPGPGSSSAGLLLHTRPLPSFLCFTPGKRPGRPINAPASSLGWKNSFGQIQSPQEGGRERLRAELRPWAAAPPAQLALHLLSPVGWLESAPGSGWPGFLSVPRTGRVGPTATPACSAHELCDSS